jgi:membrane associated rhomboid family serine protease
VIVFRSRLYPACRERAIVLEAVGIRCELAYENGFHLIHVAPEDSDRAASELAAYEAESQTPPPRVEPLPDQPGALYGVVAYAAVLMLVAILAQQHALDADWLERGALRVGPLLAGEWWRAVTALTLHLDTWHLLANLAVGSLFGFYAGRLLGSGLAWFSIVLAGAAGNLMNALLQSPAHRSAGASTAVFAAIGLLSAFGWVRRRHLRNWARRSGPIVGGVLLLAYIGTGGERTDIVAHLTGFLAGVGFGAVYGLLPGLHRLQSAAARRALLAASGALLAGAWALALTARG